MIMEEEFMIVFALIGIVLGLGLGVRFKVLVLVPVQLIITLLGCLCLVARATSWVGIFQSVGVCSIAIQVGYMCITVIQTQRRPLLLAMQRKA